MNEKNDPGRKLFTCERCGFWPMAVQSDRPFSPEASFACPRCKAHALFNTRQPSRSIDADRLPGDLSKRAIGNMR